MVTQQELGGRLADAREKSGMTQEQVAEALGIPRTAVTQMEGGNRQVTSLELLQMARLYGMDVRDILEGGNGAEVVALYRRKARGATTQEERAIVETLPLCRAAADLEDLLEAHNPAGRPLSIPRYAVGALRGSPAAQGIQLAGLERDRLALGFGPISDVALLVFRHGIIVAEHALPESVSGIFLHPGANRSFILLNKDETYARRQFSLAHEYCHALADSQQQVIVSRRDDPASGERRADAFASAFLVPREGVVQFATQQAITPEKIDFTHVTKLAVRYGISYDAALIAMRQAGFVTDVQKAELQKKSKQAAGYAHSSLGQQEPAYANTTLRDWTFNRMLKALEAGLISRRKAIAIATELGYPEAVVRENLDLIQVEE